MKISAGHFATKKGFGHFMVKKEKSTYRKVLVQLLKSLVLWIILVGIVTHPAIKRAVKEAMINFTGSGVEFVCNQFHIPVHISGYPYISIFHFKMEILYECSAYNYYLLVIALSVFALWPWKNMIFNGLIMLLTIFIMNTLRFIMMGYIGRYHYSMFDSIHNYFWNIFFALLLLLMWVWLGESGEKAYLNKLASAGNKRK
ncbi:MAG: exosortase/archaeosortase family protein [Bacteroidales bacterium]|nr:exosortase/archaeosortase family protein [Bacteroidales bacterium]